MIILVSMSLILNPLNNREQLLISATKYGGNGVRSVSFCLGSL